MPKGDGDDCLCSDPALVDGANIVLRWQRLENGDGERERLPPVVLVARHGRLGTQEKLLCVVNVLVFAIFNPDPPAVASAVDLPGGRGRGKGERCISTGMEEKGGGGGWEGGKRGRGKGRLEGRAVEENWAEERGKRETG